MTDQTTPGSANALNVALGVLATGLALAIVGVLFVGRDDTNPSAGAETTVSSDIVTTSTVLPTTEPSSAEETSTTQPNTPFEMPASIQGEWRSEDGSTVVQFGPSSIDALQSETQIEGSPAVVGLVEPSALGALPSATQPVQAVLFVTVTADASQTRPEPVLAEFLATDEGLRLIFEIAGTMVEDLLRPTS